MRVSIVATALDGQQPEPKSVINMVHRIQNRNPGYSEFSNSVSAQSFQFTNNSNSIITNGANALKIDEDIKNEDLSSNNFDNSELNETTNTLKSESFEQMEVSKTTPVNSEFENTTVEEAHERNGLENFELSEEDTPELFNSDTNEDSFTKSEEANSEEEDLEIPAFLRRQKN